jgi:hypothetical protein
MMALGEHRHRIDVSIPQRVDKFASLKILADAGDMRGRMKI